MVSHILLNLMAVSVFKTFSLVFLKLSITRVCWVFVIICEYNIVAWKVHNVK